jgi:Flp pilus assembly pilin Flp
MFRVIRRFLRANQGQDLAEYCLLTALVALLALGIFWHLSGGVNALWSNTNTSLNSAGNAATVSSGATAGAATPSK